MASILYEHLFMFLYVCVMFHCSVTLGKILHEDCSLCISDDSELVLVIAQDAICCFVWVW